MLVQGSFEVASPAGLVTDGATALKQSPATYRDELTAATSAEFEQLEWSAPASAPKPTAADKRAEARMKGYVGEACPECANFTMVRNGTCLKCDTCGSTTGCS
jgi:ribonucleoside-diphosphate reductase alpha chain